MRLDRRRIETIVPQSGAMCLLEAVPEWDESRITCISHAPRRDHPLARDGELPCVAACEYAAQATAVHGALVDGASSPRAGMLAALVDVHLHGDWFPAGGHDVMVRAQLLSRTEAGCLYAFEVAMGERRLADGQLMVAFSAQGST